MAAATLPTTITTTAASKAWTALITNHAHLFPQELLSSFSQVCTTWPHSWTRDGRVPLWTVNVNVGNVIAGGGGGVQRYGFYTLHIFLWTELLLLFVLQACMAAVFGLLVYHFILARRNNNRHRHQENDNDDDKLKKSKKQLHSNPSTGMTAWFLTYGVVIPFWSVAPVYYLRWLGMNHRTFLFALGVVTPTLCIFRTAEALYGYAPSHVTQSCSSYVLYFSSALTLKYDFKTQKYVPCSLYQSFLHLLRFLAYAFLCGAYFSLFTLWGPSAKSSSLPWFTFPRLGTSDFDAPGEHERRAYLYRPESIWDVAGIWKDSALYAILLQSLLYTFCEGLIFATALLTGAEAEPIMRNPMFASTSPSDFWGRRWNLLVHDVLKNGVFKPVYYSRWMQACFPASSSPRKVVAVVASFLASGLFHENILHVMFWDFPFKLGPTMCFFLWQALLVGAETVVVASSAAYTNHPKMLVESSKHGSARRPASSLLAGVTTWWNGANFYFLQLCQQLPLPIRSVLTVSLGLPFAHWFLDPYVNSDFLIHAQTCLFSFLPVENLQTAGIH